MNTCIRTTLFLFCALLFGACQMGTSNPPQWVSTSATAPSEAVVWEVALFALQEAKFPVGAGVDPSTRLASTGWRNSLAPFKSEGYRKRAHKRLEPLEGGKYRLYLHVEMETNEELARPMQLDYAQWESAPDDLETAQILISKIDARLGGALEIGENKARTAPKTQN